MWLMRCNKLESDSHFKVFGDLIKIPIFLSLNVKLNIYFISTYTNIQYTHTQTH